MKKETTALFGLISSMIIFGTIGIFRRYIPFPSSFLAMVRGFIGALFLLLIMLMLRKKPDMAEIKSNLVPLLISGGCIGFNWILLFEAYNYTSVATATLCYYFEPTFVILFTPIFLHSKLTPKKIFCVLLAFVGMVFVSGILDTGIGKIQEMKGVLMGLGAAVIYAFVILINKRMCKISAYGRTAIQLFFASVVLIPYVLFTGAMEDLPLSPFNVAMTAIVCIVHTGVAYALYFGSFENLPTETLALFSYIDPVVAVLLSAFILHEKMTVFTVIGAVLILGAAIWGELPEKKQKIE